MKRKTAANLVMVLLILLIVGAGIFGVGFVQGWFDTDDGARAVLQNVRGVVRLERDGVNLMVEQDTVLRPGDQITSQTGATATVRIGENEMILGGSVSMSIEEATVEAFAADIQSGEVFTNCLTDITICCNGRKMVLDQTTALISVRSGAQSIGVLRGNVEDAGSGQTIEYVGEEKTVGALTPESLNEFAITQIRALNDTALCFTSADLDALEAKRQQALQDLLNNQETDDSELNDTGDAAESNTDDDSGETTDSAQTPDTTIDSDSSDEDSKTDDPLPPADTTQPDTSLPADLHCTIAIFCHTILENMGDLAPGKAEFVPSDGVILSPVTVAYSAGETVFDVLQRACTQTGLQLEYSWTPLYDSYYVEGINQLYEFDCGFESGWMYKVNDWFPNYGCSSYTVEDGDVIVWCYTCKGLGVDVGATRME